MIVCMPWKHNSLRTRLTQVADLRDAQGIREDQRAILARLNEVEECASVHTLREFMSKILRLEAMLSGEQGGVIGEAIRVCNRRIDTHRTMMEDFHARISTQDWYHDFSDQDEDEESQVTSRDVNAENQSGVSGKPYTLVLNTKNVPRLFEPSCKLCFHIGIKREVFNSIHLPIQALWRPLY